MAKMIGDPTSKVRLFEKGDLFVANPDERLCHRHQIEVRRVAKDGSWVDIAVMSWAVMWTKRQPLKDGDFAFPYETGVIDFDAQQDDHMAMLSEKEQDGWR